VELIMQVKLLSASLLPAPVIISYLIGACANLFAHS